MAHVALVKPQSYANFFISSILTNVTYWQTNPAVQSLDVAVLDQEREGLIRAIRFGLRVDEAWPTVCQLVETLSPYMERRGYWAVWEQVLEQTFTLSQQRGDAAKCVVFSLLLARLLKRQSKIKQTIYQYRRAIDFARQAGSQFNEGRSYTNLGYLYVELGQWFRAEVLCCYALDLFKQIENEYGQAHTYNHLGVLFTWQGVWDKAQLYLESACALWKKMKDHHGLMSGLINLSSLYILRQQPVQALRYLQDADYYAHMTGDELELATIHMNKGIAYQYTDLAEAENCIRKAEAIYQKFSNLTGLAQAWSNLGITLLKQNRAREAAPFLQRSLNT